MDIPETRYALSGDVSIAYQVVGEGPFDLVWTPGAVSNVELGWDEFAQARFRLALASFARLILFDKRGTGLSDRVNGIPDLETRTDDIRAVMDAAGSARAVIAGVSEGGPMAIVFAATYPERTQALVLYGRSSATGSRLSRRSATSSSRSARPASRRNTRACWLRCSSRTSSVRPRRPPSSATAAGVSCSSNTARGFAGSSRSIAASSSTPRGDGFFARFDGPARAIRCACAISESMHGLGIDVRAGLHSGECELVDNKVAGIAVSIGARVTNQARPGEVLGSQTVRDLVAGSGFAFEDRGAAELKGVPGEWRLYAVADAAS